VGEAVNRVRVHAEDIVPGMVLEDFDYDPEDGAHKQLGLVLGEVSTYDNGEKPTSGLLLFLVLLDGPRLVRWGYLHGSYEPCVVA
jgi:hypothetical protein